jgi:hypothetical protein
MEQGTIIHVNEIIREPGPEVVHPSFGPIQDETVASRPILALRGHTPRNTIGMGLMRKDKTK